MLALGGWQSGQLHCAVDAAAVRPTGVQIPLHPLEYYKEGFSRLLDGRPKRPPIDFGGDRPLRGRKGRGSIRRFFGRMIFYCIINNV